MRFLKSLFTSKASGRAQLRNYVNMEFRPEEREAAYHRLVRDAGFY